MSRNSLWKSAAAALALALIHPVPLAAQEQDPEPPPYDDQMQRLSEIMGALHFLQQLCNDTESSPWRDEMSALLAAEQPDSDRRARLIDAFNRGYGSYRSVYRTCTPSAELVIQRYHDEGTEIAIDVGARYGRPDGE